MEDKERLAKIETAIEGIEKLLTKLETKIDTFNDNMDKKFIPRIEAEGSNKRIHERIDDIEEELSEIKKEVHLMREKSSRIPAWAASAITFLIALIGALIEAHYIK